MKPERFDPLHKPKRTPVNLARDISPTEFKSLWDTRYEEFEAGLKAKLDAAQERQNIKQRRSDHLKSLRAKGLTLQAIGDLVGLTRERVRQLLLYQPKTFKELGYRRAIERKDERFFSIWRGMLNRCDNKNDANYGGRGIKVCKRWRVYANFEDDMWDSYSEHVHKFGEFDTTIDRINVNGNYEPSNCRWATKLVQGNNKRTSKSPWGRDVSGPLLTD